jgi:DNA-binding NtrC family response regulator
MAPGVRTKGAKGQASPPASAQGEAETEREAEPKSHAAPPATTPSLPMQERTENRRGIIEGGMERRPPARLTEEPPTVLRRDSGTRKAHPIVDVVPKLTLEVRREAGREPRVVVHEGPVCSIGTHSSNDVVLFDPSVSRFHCKLTCDGAGWRVRDIGSLNGTELNGVRIRDADLKSEGTLALGDCILHARGLEPATPVDVPEVDALDSFGALAGTSIAMRKLFAYLEKVSASDINVLIEGESGTGKEVVASEIFQRGPRADKAFVIVDCGAISPNLVESELFGHVRGAFTGADRERIGAFEAADGGTVFLDEIGELPLELQPKLLRTIESRAIRRVGETRSRKVDVRVIAATNRDLHREVNRGRFREDLYFRLAVMTVHVPPLRERIEDLPALVRSFLTALGVTPHDQRQLFSPSVLAELSGHDWPGNVRELRNYVERSVVLQETLPASKRLASEPPLPGASDGEEPLPFKLAKDAVVDNFERSYLSALLEAAGGNISKAARKGGMDRMYLHRLIQKHGLRQGSRSGEE